MRSFFALLSSLCLIFSMAASAANAPLPTYTKAEQRHWAYQPRTDVSPPTFQSPEDQKWAQTPIDAFVLEQLKAKNVQPAPEANRRVLIRRLSFDLLGLPPTPAEVEAFVNDPAPDAYEKLVDRLLASPHYGERWAQHWLDVVRFAETDGFEYDKHRNGAWRFRDYVIDSYNQDKPYDRFLTEQLAGDEIDPDDHALRIATGFNRMGPLRLNAGNQEIVQSRNEVLTEMTNIVGAAMLGMTVGCARCHDHKFDPIRHSDYYRMQGFFASTFFADVQLAPQSEQDEYKAVKEKLDKEAKEIGKLIKEAKEKGDTETVNLLARKSKDLQNNAPEPPPAIFSVESKPHEAKPIHILTRGNDELKEDTVGMRPLGILVSPDHPELPVDTPAPRTRLAQWLVNPAHPLTPRVMANRIWKYHFDRGIMENPNDFGRMGGVPSHKALLDYLSNQFVAQGWSVKSMHRLIVNTNTYRQAFETPHMEANLKIDPENKYLWHSSRKRLEAEQLRDAMLAVAGELNPKTGGPSVMIPVQQELVDLLYTPGQWKVDEDPAEHNRRSIYLIAKRNLRLPFMEVFDSADRLQSCARRESSTHAPQSLELLNGAFANRMAEALAERLEREAGDKPADQVKLAYNLVAGRAPTEQELAVGTKFLKEQPLREFALATLNLSSFLYVE